LPHKAFNPIKSSFTYETLGGAFNGGSTNDWFFYPSILKSGGANLWRTRVIGGETRPESGDVFEPYYPANSTNKQPFSSAVQIVHATYITHTPVWEPTFSLEALTKARLQHARVGYNFRITMVELYEDANSQVKVAVTVKQIGFAPFYFPLSLKLACPDLPSPKEVSGVESIIAYGDSDIFTFAGVPDSILCLSDVELSLTSPKAYDSRPIKFAQGTDGRVVLSLPSTSTVVMISAKEGALGTFGHVAVSNAAVFIDTSSSISGIERYGYAEDLYRWHYWSDSDLVYTFSGLAPWTSYVTTMGFSETYAVNCWTGMRVFNILANGVQIMSNFDIYAVTGGCQRALVINENVESDFEGKIILNFQQIQGKNNPMCPSLCYRRLR
jgi:Malectin domain